jgi:hypothetical protein
MDRVMNPTVRAKRILAKMARFRASFKDGLPGYTSLLAVRPGEEVVGVYENIVGKATECVVVTDQRLLVERHGIWESVEFSEVEAIEIPEPAHINSETAALTVRKTGGALTFVSIKGNEGQFFDVYEFCRFLMRVVNDAKATRER